jgi:predicted AAA+ superfamily ATPase
MKIERTLSGAVKKALLKKMVFIGGPRQVGKTTFSFQLVDERANPRNASYFNWDDPRTPSKLRAMEFPIGSTWLILDEIHKYNKWRNLVKGIFDIEGTARKIIVTGSARLDYYRKGGDSLIGRYRYFRLHPFSLNEVSSSPSEKDLARLLKFGGFPEPFLSQDPAEHRIWQRDRMSKVIREDLRDLENVREISLLEHLADILPSRVGSPLSIKSLREDLEVDHKSVSRWLHIFENLYISFRISPYGAPKIRAVKKEQKLYLWDWSLVEDPGSRFENLVACQLLKYCHWMEDVEGYKMDLRFIRDTDKREIDFVVLKQGKPEFAVECKTGDKALSPHLNYFEQRTLIPRFYQVHQGSQSFSRGKFYLLPFTEFCKKMKMP